MWLARSEARKRTVWAISAGVATLRRGMPSLNCSGSPAMVRAMASSSGSMPRSMGVSVEPGDTRLARTPKGASSSPTVWVRLVTAALEAQ